MEKAIYNVIVMPRDCGDTLEFGRFDTKGEAEEWLQERIGQCLDYTVIYGRELDVKEREIKTVQIVELEDE